MGISDSVEDAYGITSTDGTMSGAEIIYTEEIPELTRVFLTD